jgi:alkylhydroperoxidase family enzyme
MTRIPVHTIDTAPDASRANLDHILKGPGGLGRVLNLQAQMAHAPAVLAGYVALRKAIEEHATLDFKTRSAIQLTVSAGGYSTAINSMLGARAGWADDDVDALRAGAYAAEPRLTALLAVVRAAAAHAGRVDDPTWAAAIAAGWTDTELAEAFICIALTSYVDTFVAYAGTELDVAVEPSRT